MEDTLKYTPTQKLIMHRHLENCVEHLQSYLVSEYRLERRYL